MFHFKNTAIWTSSFHSAWHQNRNAVSSKKSLSSWFSAVWPFQVLEDMIMRTYSSEKKSFYRQRVLQMFLLISGGHIGAPIWRLHTKLYKGAWNVSANNSETVGHKDLRLGQIVYILVFYNISFSWLLPLDGFQFFFFCYVAVKTIYSNVHQFSPNSINTYLRLKVTRINKMIAKEPKCFLNWFLTNYLTQFFQENVWIDWLTELDIGINGFIFDPQVFNNVWILS